MLHANIKNSRTDSVMACAGYWTDLKYVVAHDDCIIRALIPQSALLENGRIPQIIVTLINIPCRANQLKLRVKYGVTVAYDFAEADKVELKEAV